MSASHSRSFLDRFVTASHLAFIAAGLVSVIGAWEIKRSHDTLLTEAEGSAQNLARSLAQHATRAFEGVDLVLSGTVEQVEGNPDPDHLKAYLQRRARLTAQVRNLVVINADGLWIADSVPPHAPLNSVGLEYFAWHRDHEDTDLRISDPIRSRYGNSLIIPLSRRINNPDGSFGGVASAALMPESLQAFYDKVHLGKQGSISLYRADGHILTRYPSAAANANLDQARVAQSVKDFAAPSGLNRGRAHLDGVDRIVAMEHVEGYPLVVTAGVAVDDVLSDWRHEAPIEGGALALLSLGLIIVGLASERDRRKVRMIAREAEEINARYQLLAESCSDIVALKPSFSGSRSYVSPSVVATLGWEPAAFAAQTAVESIHPDDLDRVAALYATLTPDTPRFTSQHRLLHKAGHYVWVESVFQLTRAGALDQSVIVAARDITTRRAAEEALRESEVRYRLLATASSDMIARLSLDARQTYVSPAAFEVLGYDPDAMIGRSFLAFVHPDCVEPVGALVDRLIGGHLDKARSIHRAVHQEGHDLWVDVQFRLVRDAESGTPVEIICSLRDVTDREMLKVQAEEANRQLMMAEEIAHVGHWQVDLRTNSVTWSEEVYRIHGLDPANYTPTLETAIDCYHPEDRSAVTQMVTEAIQSRKSYEFKLRILRPDGAVRHVLSRGLCQTDPGTGTVIALFGAIMDLTEVAEAERRFRRESSLLETTLNNMDQGLVKVTTDGTIVLSNRRFLELFDLPGELFSHPHPRFADIAAFLRKSGEIQDDEPRAAAPSTSGSLLALGTHEHRRPNGQIFEVRTVRVPSGSTVSTFADITARRRAEDALRESEARYRMLADTTSDVITQLDLDLIRRYVSPACRTMLGYEPKEMLGITPAVLIHPDDAPDVRTAMQALAAGHIPGDRTTLTNRMRHKQGHWIWLEAGINLLRDPETGAPTSLVCSLRDVTERQRTTRHLERARAAAEAAVIAKAEFMANMSHELRTPLTGMLGIHDLLRRDPALSSPQKRLVGLASESGRSLLNIVNDILDFSKIEAGQLAIESVPFDLRDLIETCQALAAEGLNGKPVTIEARFSPPEPGRFIGDPSRIRQVLLNLLTNAGKFTPQGTVTIDITYRPDDEILRIGVTDTGIGIAKQKVPLLFERFSQADASTARRYGGTGLGLAISKHLVELMGGRIGVETQEGEGSCFWFEHPLQPHRQPGALDGTVDPASDVAQTRCRILLAEDNLVNQEIIGAMLTNLGHAVTPVLDGATAVEAVVAADEDGGPFDLILMDLQMPGMDGLTATEVIRQRELAEDRRRLPIIGLTANALAEDVARCVQAGMDAHVAKPIHWPTLFGTIDTIRLTSLKAAASAAPEPALDVDAVDHAMLDGLACALGRERLGRMLAGFANDVERRRASLDRVTPIALSAHAHALVSMAGQLGFVGLSKLCIAIEAEASQGGGLQRLAELGASAERVVVLARAYVVKLAA